MTRQPVKTGRQAPPRKQNALSRERVTASVKQDRAGKPAVLSEAARRSNPLAGEPSGIIGSQEYRDLCNVFRLSESAKRCRGDDLLFEVAADNTGVPRYGKASEVRWFDAARNLLAITRPRPTYRES